MKNGCLVCGDATVVLNPAPKCLRHLTPAQQRILAIVGSKVEVNRDDIFLDDMLIEYSYSTIRSYLTGLMTANLVGSVPTKHNKRNRVYFLIQPARPEVEYITIHEVKT